MQKKCYENAKTILGTRNIKYVCQSLLARELKKNKSNVLSLILLIHLQLLKKKCHNLLFRLTTMWYGCFGYK
uniref:Uncharacterized protein n=1 Tax=Lepeophtheirus salmonis TaxID=72036 RepID=A0A0K2THR1_LEPSM